MSSIDEIVDDYFNEYVKVSGRDYLTYVKTFGYKSGASSHGIEDNAIDITLRSNGKYAWITEYIDLMAYNMSHWALRAGIDLTYKVTKEGKHPNVHLHFDKGATVHPDDLPQFFIEDNGQVQKFITDVSELK